VLETVKALGVTLNRSVAPMRWRDGGTLGAESGASFDEFIRSRRDQTMTNKTRSNGMRQSRLVPAVSTLKRSASAR
jgi:hypothetical protein